MVRLQEYGRIPIVELAKEPHMSESTYLRRAKSLEEAGVIKGYSAILDAEKAGFGVMVFVQVSINQKNEAAFDKFKNGSVSTCLFLNATLYQALMIT